jgi:YebC/PmpR family DNA-binding regulatory protein
MSGHNKWSQIKQQKAKTDGQKSKVFSKYARLITSESKKSNGNISFPSLATVIEKAKKENVPKDVIERAIKKGTESGTVAMDNVLYECYGPGGVAIIIEGLTDNKNRAAQEVRHALSKQGYELAAQGSASWAFVKENGEWNSTTTIPISDDDGEKLQKLVDSLEELDDVQNVYHNAE